jgi:hypothetical protein
MDDVIFKLETLVEQDQVQSLVRIDQPPWEETAAANSLIKATANVFDMDLTDVLPSAANDFVGPGQPVMVSDPGHVNYTVTSFKAQGQDQWSTRHEGMYQEMCAKASEYRGTSVAKYVVEVRRKAKRQGSLPQQISEKKLLATAMSESTRYLTWLCNRDSSAQRERTESVRKQADQAYVMQLGMQVHPLYHGGKKTYDNMIKAMQANRIRAFDNGLMGNERYGTWFTRVTGIINLANNMEFFITDQVNKEALADKLIANAIVQKHEEQVSFKQWAYMVESQHLPVETTTVSEDSPSTPVAEVVDLNSFRTKRTEDVGALLAKLKPKLSNLTEEQKEGVRIAMDMLKEMMG